MPSRRSNSACKSAPARAEGYFKDKTITIILPNSAGRGNDTVLRYVVPYLKTALAAKDVLVRGLNDGGHRFLTRCLEITHGLCEDVPLDDTLDEISYQEIMWVLRARDSPTSSGAQDWYSPNFHYR